MVTPKFGAERPGIISEQQVTLVKQRIATTQIVGMDVLESLRVDAFEDYLLHGMMVRLAGYVTTEQLPSHVAEDTVRLAVDIPTSWWQHFKEQYSDKWFMRPIVKRRPVRTTIRTSTYTLRATWDNMATYPWSDYVTNLPAKFGEPVRVTTMRYEVERD